MILRTISIIALLSLSTFASAEEPPKAPATNTTEATPKATPEANSTGEAAPAPVDNTPSTTPTEGGTNVDAKPAEGEGSNTAAPTGSPDGAGTPPGEGSNKQEAVKQEPMVEKSEPTPAEEHSAGGHFTVEEMWNQSSGPVRSVLGTLLFMLVAAMGVGLERLISLQSARAQSRRLASEVGALLNEGKMKAALDVCGRDDMAKSYLGHMLEAGLKEFSTREDQYGIDAVERAIEKNAITETASLNKGLNILATVGSTAPFVGLVGTIFGIINAFGQIGAEGGADLTTLAPAIGEALITTAFGIIVAIVGVWLFNYFTALIGSITNDMAESSQELVDWCHKRILPPQESKSAK